MDNTGTLYYVRVTFPNGTYPGPDYAEGRTELVRYDPQRGEHVVAFVEDRSSPAGGGIDHIRPTEANTGLANVMTFDPQNGQILVTLHSYCPGGGYDAGSWIAAIQGFATLFDVLQTYTPPPSQLGFRVPYMPEGLGGADHFDTYWGPLTKPIDFTQSHPLQCGYPGTPPHVGDYETVSDTLPTPGPDSGYYYVTATTFQGQTRYGRKASGGKLSGRDPALLPACVQP